MGVPMVMLVINVGATFRGSDVTLNSFILILVFGFLSSNLENKFFSVSLVEGISGLGY